MFYKLGSEMGNKDQVGRNLTIINFVILAYFGILYFVNYYKVDFVLIGVFREILTIPFLIAEIVFLVLGVKHLLKFKTLLITKISILLLGACALLTIGGFFR